MSDNKADEKQVARDPVEQQDDESKLVSRVKGFLTDIIDKADEIVNKSSHEEKATKDEEEPKNNESANQKTTTNESEVQKMSEESSCKELKSDDQVTAYEANTEDGSNEKVSAELVKTEIEIVGEDKSVWSPLLEQDDQKEPEVAICTMEFTQEELQKPELVICPTGPIDEREVPILDEAEVNSVPENVKELDGAVAALISSVITIETDESNEEKAESCETVTKEVLVSAVLPQEETSVLQEAEVNLPPQEVTDVNEAISALATATALVSTAKLTQNDQSDDVNATEAPVLQEAEVNSPSEEAPVLQETEVNSPSEEASVLQEAEINSPEEMNVLPKVNPLREAYCRIFKISEQAFDLVEEFYNDHKENNLISNGLLYKALVQGIKDRSEVKAKEVDVDRALGAVDCDDDQKINFDEFIRLLALFFSSKNNLSQRVESVLMNQSNDHQISGSLTQVEANKFKKFLDQFYGKTTEVEVEESFFGKIITKLVAKFDNEERDENVDYKEFSKEIAEELERFVFVQFAESEAEVEINAVESVVVIEPKVQVENHSDEPETTMCETECLEAPIEVEVEATKKTTSEFDELEASDSKVESVAEALVEAVAETKEDPVEKKEVETKVESVDIDKAVVSSISSESEAKEVETKTESVVITETVVSTVSNEPETKL